MIGSYHNIFRVGAIMQDLGFWILNDVVWRKSNPMPNFRGTRFTNAHETLIWASMGEKARYHFNYRAMKTLTDELQMRSDLVHADLRRAGTAQAGLGTGFTRRSSLRRCSTSRAAGDDRKPADVVLDPFFGTGTTGAVAKLLFRQMDRLRARVRLSRGGAGTYPDGLPLGSMYALQTMQSQRAAPKVAFGALVEGGFLSRAPNCSIGSAAGPPRCAPTARSSAGARRGSIHGVGKALQGLPSCNAGPSGMSSTKAQAKPIDSLRQLYLRRWRIERSQRRRSAEKRSSQLVIPAKAG